MVSTTQCVERATRLKPRILKDLTYGTNQQQNLKAERSPVLPSMETLKNSPTLQKQQVTERRACPFGYRSG